MEAKLLIEFLQIINMMPLTNDILRKLIWNKKTQSTKIADSKLDVCQNLNLIQPINKTILTYRSMSGIKQDWGSER